MIHKVEFREASLVIDFIIECDKRGLQTETVVWYDDTAEMTVYIPECDEE